MKRTWKIAILAALLGCVLAFATLIHCLPTGCRSAKSITVAEMLAANDMQEFNILANLVKTRRIKGIPLLPR